MLGKRSPILKCSHSPLATIELYSHLTGVISSNYIKLARSMPE